MNIPQSPAKFDPGNENTFRQALKLADLENFKKGQDVNLARGEKLFLSTLDALTAHAGGGQAGALQLTTQISRVATVAGAGDSVRLFPSAKGLWQVVTNSGAHAMQVFGVSPDTINGAATATGVSVPAGATGLYFCPVAGLWFGGVLT